MRVTSVEMVKGSAKVLWSKAQNIPAYAKDTVITVPSGLMQNGDSIVMAEVSYDYDSTLGYFLPSAKTLDEVFYLRPRRTDKVEKTD